MLGFEPGAGEGAFDRDSAEVGAVISLRLPPKVPIAVRTGEMAPSWGPLGADY